MEDINNYQLRVRVNDAVDETAYTTESVDAPRLKNALYQIRAKYETQVPSEPAPVENP